MKSIVTTNNQVVNYTHVLTLTKRQTDIYATVIKDNQSISIVLVSGTTKKIDALYNDLINFLESDQKVFNFSEQEKRYSADGNQLPSK